MSGQIFPVAKSAWIDEAKYKSMYERSVADNEGFWAEHGRRLDWIKPYTKIKDVSFSGDVHIKWFYDGTLNASANCIDRHLAKRANQTAIIWEADDPNEKNRFITYKELHEQVSRLANVMKKHGVKKDDSRSRLCAACLRPDRRRPFRGVRRLLAGVADRPHSGLRFEFCHHRR
jgi:hypothetical protein